MRDDFADRVDAAAASVRKSGISSVHTGMILGSGLSDLVDDLFPGEPQEIPYGAIEGFGAPSVSGHRGTMYVGNGVAVMAGRFHFYEGRSMDDVVLPVATLCALGASVIVVTNAAGGINPEYTPGDLVLISDHINLMGTNPLIGPEVRHHEARFPDMTEPYSRRLRDTAVSLDSGLKSGVYVALTGPSYETPAEIRMLRALGGDLVGMSTVPEVIVARSLGSEVLGISTVTNAAAGMSGKPLDHAEVVEVGKSIHHRMIALLRGIMTSTES